MSDDRAEVERLARIMCEARGDNPDDIVAVHGTLPRNRSGKIIISGQPVQMAWCACYHEAIAVLADRKLEETHV